MASRTVAMVAKNSTVNNVPIWRSSHCVSGARGFPKIDAIMTRIVRIKTAQAGTTSRNSKLAEEPDRFMEFKQRFADRARKWV